MKFTWFVITIVSVFTTSINQNQMDKNKETATLGSGCFWCTEAIYEDIKGVTDAVSGYSGGHVKNPSYKEVCTGNTGHAEVVQITFNPEIISYAEILNIFFKTHDPTSLNRQGADVGTQYRSVIFYHSQEQKEIAERKIKELNENKVFEDPIVTIVEEFNKFYPAEDYHQDYFAKNPDQAYCSFVIKPKVNKFQKDFSSFLKENP